MCIISILISFVSAILSVYLWAIGICLEYSRAREEIINGNDIEAYNIYVPEQFRENFPITVWKPVRGAFEWWLGCKDSYSLTIDDFWSFLEDTKTNYPKLYEILMNDKKQMIR